MQHEQGRSAARGASRLQIWVPATQRNAWAWMEMEAPRRHNEAFYGPSLLSLALKADHSLKLWRTWSTMKTMKISLKEEEEAQLRNRLSVYPAYRYLNRPERPLGRLAHGADDHPSLGVLSVSGACSFLVKSGVLHHLSDLIVHLASASYPHHSLRVTTSTQDDSLLRH